MGDNKTSIELLKKELEKKDKIIKNYESVSSAYRLFKRLPVIGGAKRFFGSVIRTKNENKTVINHKIASKNPNIIAVASPLFRGVNSATKEMVPDVLEVSEVHERDKAKEVAKMIMIHKPDKVLISGYAIGHDLIAEELKKIASNLRIFALIHGPFIWFDVYPKENKAFEHFLQLQKLGIVEKIGFCKRDLAEYFKELGYNSFFVMNRFYPEKHSLKSIADKEIKIGIWGSNLWHRNITNQTVAALMIPGTQIHVNEITEHPFLDMSRIKAHGILPKEEFHKILSQMDINLYISLTDSFPMTLVESMQYGIPAIASDTSDVYTFNEKIHDQLTVSTIDGPLGIKRKIEEVINNYEEIQKEIKGYLPVLKKETEKSIEEFLK